MVIIYDKDIFKIDFLYSGSTSQVGLLQNNSDNSKNYKEVIFDDDTNVLNNTHQYRLVHKHGHVITYAKKPTLNLTLSKDVIINNGTDSTILTVSIDNTHPLDEFVEVDINIDENVYTIELEDNVGQLEITAINEGLINIKCADDNFICEAIQLEVI